MGVDVGGRMQNRGREGGRDVGYMCGHKEIVGGKWLRCNRGDGVASDGRTGLGFDLGEIDDRREGPRGKVVEKKHAQVITPCPVLSPRSSEEDFAHKGGRLGGHAWAPRRVM